MRNRLLTIIMHLANLQYFHIKKLSVTKCYQITSNGQKLVSIVEKTRQPPSVNADVPSGPRNEGCNCIKYTVKPFVIRYFFFNPMCFYKSKEYSQSTYGLKKI